MNVKKFYIKAVFDINESFDFRYTYGKPVNGEANLFIIPLYWNRETFFMTDQASVTNNK